MVSCFGSLWIDGSGGTDELEPIATPFPTVADHVVESPRVGREQTHRRREFPSVFQPLRAISFFTADVGFVAVPEFVTPIQAGVGAGLAGVFPLSLGWQTIQASLFR